LRILPLSVLSASAVNHTELGRTIFNKWHDEYSDSTRLIYCPRLMPPTSAPTKLFTII